MALTAAAALAFAGATAVAGASPGPTACCLHAVAATGRAAFRHEHGHRDADAGRLRPIRLVPPGGLRPVAGQRRARTVRPGPRDSPRAGVLPAISARRDVHLDRQRMFVEGESAATVLPADGPLHRHVVGGFAENASANRILIGLGAMPTRLPAISVGPQGLLRQATPPSTACGRQPTATSEIHAQALRNREIGHI